MFFLSSVKSIWIDKTSTNTKGRKGERKEKKGKNKENRGRREGVKKKSQEIKFKD